MSDFENDNNLPASAGRIEADAGLAALRAIAKTIADHPDAHLLPDAKGSLMWATIQATVAAFMNSYPNVDVVPLIEMAARTHFDHVWAMRNGN